ncbi:competence type IV pilus major pilin ComGC [Fredinandcohnia quinoae]|uniref:ComG operon protein 3 n=1 Tax=Fredinandcohnia quinoae TaxID=2918902 RepID=A0AAW5DWA8_9BACI|nr:competence type IV pilus major pilin ComGC [Fredinandcohnia sp. SECRCQ15]MCH1624916.1 prepilin-type N-terminal cleavage/methylation domain-containing protein [Fredinandcohnia sp. SECRCQ15]
MGQKGFTLIEMMIVLLVISILLLITIPNVTKHNSVINNKGCEAYVKMVEAQAQAYEIETGKFPTSITDLFDGKYLKAEDAKCPNGDTVTINNGAVTVTKNEP